MTTVTITPVTTPDALFCRYPGEHTIQDAYLALDLETGQMWCDYNGEIGDGRPESVFHGRTLRFDIPVLTGDAANTLMAGVTDLAQRILDGAEIVWNGHNHVGQLTDDAAEASGDLADLCDPQNLTWDDGQQVQEWTADEWYSVDDIEQVIARLGITAYTTDAEITALTEAEEISAREGSNLGWTILTGVDEYLTGLRDALAADVDPDELLVALGAQSKVVADLTAARTAAISERDRFIRIVMGTSIPRDVIVGLTGLAPARLYQIRESQR